LLAPILIFDICAMSVAAALAVLFETIPGLRGGVGNIAYFPLDFPVQHERQVAVNQRTAKRRVVRRISLQEVRSGLS